MSDGPALTSASKAEKAWRKLNRRYSEVHYFTVDQRQAVGLGKLEGVLGCLAEQVARAVLAQLYSEGRYPGSNPSDSASDSSSLLSDSDQEDIDDLCFRVTIQARDLLLKGTSESKGDSQSKAGWSWNERFARSDKEMVERIEAFLLDVATHLYNSLKKILADEYGKGGSIGYARWEIEAMLPSFDSLHQKLLNDSLFDTWTITANSDRPGKVRTFDFRKKRWRLRRHQAQFQEVSSTHGEPSGLSSERLVEFEDGPSDPGDPPPCFFDR